MKIILFEDKKADNLYPITLTRACFDILCGGLTLQQALRFVFSNDDFDFFVRDYLKQTVENKFKQSNAGDKEVLFINGSLVPDLKTLQQIKEKVSGGKDFVLKKNGNIIAAFIADLSIYVKFSSSNVLEYLEGLDIKTEDFTGRTFDNLWEIVKFNKEILHSNLEILSENYTKKWDGVFLAGNLEAADNVVFDSQEGPIVIEEDVKIEPFVELKGPLFIGKSTIIRSFSKIHMSSLGEVNRAGGEITESVMQGYSNKQHYGFLGNSYIGEWVNIGAGASNSDLKNTYGNVKMNGVDTKEQFLGCIIGDYSKIGINTSIATGKVIGVSSFLYGDAFSDVPSFSNLMPNRKFVEVVLEISQKIQEAARKRRAVETRDFDKKLLADVFDMTRRDRRKYKVKKGKISLK